MTYEIKTKKNNSDVDKFIESIEDEKRREDSKVVLEMFRRITKEEGKMWGSAIIGFGSYSYETKSGCKGDWFVVGFSPRKQYLALYVVPYVDEISDLMKKVGKAKLGRCCINVKKLEDIDMKILEKMVKLSITKYKPN